MSNGFASALEISAKIVRQNLGTLISEFAGQSIERMFVRSFRRSSTAEKLALRLSWYTRSDQSERSPNEHSQ